MYVVHIDEHIIVRLYPIFLKYILLKFTSSNKAPLKNIDIWRNIWYKHISMQYKYFLMHRFEGVFEVKVYIHQMIKPVCHSNFPVLLLMESSFVDLNMIIIQASLSGED